MTAALKTRIATLASEAVALRAEQHRHPGDSAQAHEAWYRRTRRVRPQARSALLAYGYLRGRRYRTIEAKCHEDPSWFDVADMVVLVDPSRDVKEVRLLVKAWGETQAVEPIREAA